MLPYKCANRNETIPTEITRRGVISRGTSRPATLLRLSFIILRARTRVRALRTVFRAGAATYPASVPVGNEFSINYSRNGPRGDFDAASRSGTGLAAVIRGRERAAAGSRIRKHLSLFKLPGVNPLHYRARDPFRSIPDAARRVNAARLIGPRKFGLRSTRLGRIGISRSTVMTLAVAALHGGPGDAILRRRGGPCWIRPLFRPRQRARRKAQATLRRACLS